MKTTEVATKTKWSVDQVHSEISFSVRHLLMAKVKGAFKRFDADITTTSRDFKTARIDLWIDASSAITGHPNCDKHLKSRDFLEVNKHKQITFTSNRIVRTDLDRLYELWGELTMRGVARNIKLDVQLAGILEDPRGNERVGFTITGTINRSDWGLVWNSPAEYGDLLVSDEVTISCEVELTNTIQKEWAMQLEYLCEEEAMM